MAGDWLKFELDTPDKPEVVTIAKQLGIPQTQVIGCLILVWRWFNRQTVNGDAPVTLAALGEIAGVPGFADAMLSVDWLSTSKNGEKTLVSIPAFDLHNSESAKKRALSARRNKRYRDALVTLPRRSRDADSVTKSKSKSITPKPPRNASPQVNSNTPNQGQIERKRCAFCTTESVGQVNGIDYCRAHADNAYDGTTPTTAKPQAPAVAAVPFAEPQDDIPF